MDKNQELINRRQFFQKAIEKTLPIIGFVALGNLLQACGDQLQLSNSLSNSTGSGNTGVSGNTGSKVIPSDASGSIGGVEYVDLGLSVLWARCNIGAKKPEGPSERYSPFVTEDGLNYDNYVMRLCSYFKRNINKEDISVSGSIFDKATQLLGNNWCSPTKEQLVELKDNCTIDYYNVKTGTISKEYIHRETGYLLTSKINGNSILLNIEFSRTNDLAMWNEWSSGTFYVNGAHGSYRTFSPSEKETVQIDTKWDSSGKYFIRPIVNPNSGAGNNNQGGGGSSGCGGNCSNNCSDDCYNGCTGYCEAGCSGLCDDTCYGMCEGRCTGMCVAQCRDNCDVKCDTSCSGWCKRVSI